MLVSSLLLGDKEEGAIFILQTSDLPEFGFLLVAAAHSRRDLGYNFFNRDTGIRGYLNNAVAKVLVNWESSTASS